CLSVRQDDAEFALGRHAAVGCGAHSIFQHVPGVRMDGAADQFPVERSIGRHKPMFADVAANDICSSLSRVVRSARRACSTAAPSRITGMARPMRNTCSAKALVSVSPAMNSLGPFNARQISTAETIRTAPLAPRD